MLKALYTFLILFQLCQIEQINAKFIQKKQFLLRVIINTQMIQTVYRYHAQQSDGYRYTFSTNPELGNGWIYDGIAFQVPIVGDVNIHQFHYDQSTTYGGWRFNFCKDMQPSNNGWIYDAVAFQAFENQLPGTTPVYQFHIVQSDGWRIHFSTSHQPASLGWTLDGVAFYAFPGEIQ